MNNEMIHIEKFQNISYIADKKGRILHFQSRYASCLIITLRGRIQFTFNDQTIVTDQNRGIFIPQGTAYVNECLESAESISVNFYISNPSATPCSLNGISREVAMRFYREISQTAYENTESARYELFSQLYRLAALLFQKETPKTDKERLAEKALLYLQRESGRADLQMDQVAAHCNISAVYLRRIVKERYQKTPFQLLTDLRMQKACEMLLEKRPVKEVALSVGYSDIYQFSRAFKQRFGHAPTLPHN